MKENYFQLQPQIQSISLYVTLLFSFCANFNLKVCYFKNGNATGSSICSKTYFVMPIKKYILSCLSKKIFFAVDRSPSQAQNFVSLFSFRIELLVLNNCSWKPINLKYEIFVLFFLLALLKKMLWKKKSPNNNFLNIYICWKRIINLYHLTGLCTKISF